MLRRCARSTPQVEPPVKAQPAGRSEAREERPVSAVDDEERDGRQLGEEGLACAVERRVGQLLQEDVGFAIEDAVALENRRSANGLGEVTLAGARWSKKQRVLPLRNEARDGQVVDEGPVHLLIEVEVEGVERALGIAKTGLLEAPGDESIRRSSPWPVVIPAAEVGQQDYEVPAVSRASGSVTAPGVSSAASVGGEQVRWGSTPTSFADSHSV